MKAAALLTLLLSVHVAARADFSYTSTRKTTGGAMAAMAGSAGNRTGKTYFKGQKTRSDEGDVSIVIDFDAQTLTTINNAAKTYSVSGFGDLAAANTAGANFTIDVKETGQHKTVNGFEAKELILTMQMEMATGRGPAIKAEMDMDLWISPDVAGGKELRAFYERNAAKFPAMGGGNAALQNAMTEIQKKMASLDGVPVEEVMKVKQAGGPAMPAMPQMTGAQSAQMDAARARLEAMKAQGGQQAAIAEQALARMGAMSGGRGAGAGASSGALIEMTIDSTDFSTAAIPDSVFAIPAGYQKAAAK